MAILLVAEQDARSEEQGEAPNLSRTRHYYIESNIPDEDESVIRGYPDPFGSILPAILAPHPANPGLRCTNVEVTQEKGDPFLWRAEVRWSYMVFKRRPRGESSDPDKRNENPLLRPALFKFALEPFQRALRRDLDGKAFRNSAGDWFDPPYMLDDNRGTFTITKNIPSPWNYGLYDTARDVVNLNPFLGLPAGYVKLKGLTGDESFENNQFFYTLIATFHLPDRTNVNSSGQPDWLVRIPDRGFHYLDDAGARQPLTLPDGTKPSVPLNLDTMGHLLFPADASTQYLSFRVFDTFDFATLPLGL